MPNQNVIPNQPPPTFGTMLTLLLIILGTGYTVQYEDAAAANVTIVPTRDNRVRYRDVRYTDGVLCSVNPTYKKYSFNTYADAEAAWQARNPPFTLPRGRNAFINTESCVTLTSGVGSNALMCYLFLTMGIPIDALLIAIYYHCKRRRSRFILPTQSDHRTPPPTPQNALSIFAATMLVDTAIRRGDICPITQDPLMREQALCVPLCGHIVSESGRPANNMCPLCRSATTYTTVPPSHTVVTVHVASPAPPPTPPEASTEAESR